jgi:adenylosuccinate lyase
MLDAISPVDGRYRRHTASLAPWMSEMGLIHHRVEVEVEYFLALVAMPLPQLADFPSDKVEAFRDVHRKFSAEDARWIKDKERVTNHDVKAVEYFVKEAMETLGVGAWKEFVHFGLTSQDVNNTAVPLSLKRATEQALLPLLDATIEDLARFAVEWKDVPMLARTHGQAASPVTLGKEFQVFVDRLRGQRDALANATYAAKFGGATGQFNAHHARIWPALCGSHLGPDAHTGDHPN